MVDIRILYRRGLLFLKDLVEEHGSNREISQIILDVFFKGTYTDTQFNTLNFIQTDPYINACLKEIVAILDRMYSRFNGDMLQIRVDTSNVQEFLLPPFIIAGLYADVEDADICYEELVIPLVYDNLEASTTTLNYLKHIREIIGKGGCTREIFLEKVGEFFEPIFYFPTDDTAAGFIFINSKIVLGERKDVIGMFTNTEQFRIIKISSKIYLEFYKDGILYKQEIVNINSDSGKMELYNTLSFAEPLQLPTTLLVNYQKNRRDILLCQEIR